MTKRQYTKLTDAEWLNFFKILEKEKAAGMRVPDICKRHGVTEGHYAYHKARLLRGYVAGVPPSKKIKPHENGFAKFVPQGESHIEVVIGKVVIRIPSGDEATFTRVLKGVMAA